MENHFKDTKWAEAKMATWNDPKRCFNNSYNDVEKDQDLEGCGFDITQQLNLESDPGGQQGTRTSKEAPGFS